MTSNSYGENNIDIEDLFPPSKRVKMNDLFTLLTNHDYRCKDMIYGTLKYVYMHVIKEPNMGESILKEKLTTCIKKIEKITSPINGKTCEYVYDSRTLSSINLLNCEKNVYESILTLMALGKFSKEVLEEMIGESMKEIRKV